MVLNDSYLRKVICTILFIILLFFCFPYVCGQHHHSHDHDHDHGNGHGHSHDHMENEEPASFKWSKEANEPYKGPNEEHTSNHKNEHVHNSNKPNSGRPNLWFEALGSTLLISIAPYLILFFIPLTNSKEHEPYLKVLLAFASGGLLGDAFLHLIPHALMAQGSSEGGAHSHSHSHSHSDSEEGHSHKHDTSIGVSVLGGIITFLIVEKFVRIFKGGHSHSHTPAKQEAKSSNKSGKEKQKNGKSKSEKSKNSNGSMKVAGYLNLAADFIHNFTDGLAIGASFLAGKSVGIVTTLTIFLHEIPHEIGDFAILLQSGCSRKKAMMLQLITAVGALAGTCVSLMAEGSDASVSWILPFTAGGFIYIATVSVIPELLENSHFWQSVVEVMALLLGVALMVIITWVEEMGHV